MKQFLMTCLFMVISFCAHAQETTNTINVNGVHRYAVTPEYIASMLVSLNNVYYDTQTFSFSEILTTYKGKLTEAGIDTSALSEDSMAYVLYGYDKEGTVVKYKTTSKENLQKFLSVRSVGVTKSETTMEYQLSDEQMAEYAEAALLDARKQAEALSAKMGRQIGKVIYLSDTNYDKYSEGLYYRNLKNEREYRINVSFELQ